MRTFSRWRFPLSAATYLIIAQICAAQPSYRFKHFGSSDGIHGNDANSLVQDSLGYIWIQYDGELRRFDGYKSKVYKYDPNDSSRSALNFVMGVAQTDHTGNLWITDKRGDQHLNGSYQLVRYQRRQDSFVKHEIQLSGAKFIATKIFDKNDSTLWFGTDCGLFGYNVYSRRCSHHGNFAINGEPNRSDTILDIRDRGQSLLLATTSGLWEFNKLSKSFQRPNCDVKDADLFYKNRIAGFLQCPHTDRPHHWISMGNTLIQITDNLTVIQRCSTPHDLGLWSLISVWRCDVEGMLWFANWGDGLIRYNPIDCSVKKFRHADADPQSLVTNDPTDILIDADQNVWILSNRGLSVLKRLELQFQNIRFKRGTVWANTVFTTNNVDHLMMSTHSGALPDSLWVSNLSNGRAGQFRYLRTVDGIVNNICKGKHHFWLNYRWGKKLVGYPVDPTTGFIGDGPIKVLKHDPRNGHTIHEGPLFNIWEDGREGLWVSGIPGSTLSRVDLRKPYGADGSVQHFAGVNGSVFLSENSTSVWGADEKGVSLFRSIAGPLNRYEAQRVITTREKGPVSFFKTSDGVLLLGTVRGLHVISAIHDGYQISNIRRLNGIAIKRIQEDQSGRLWLYDGSKLMCFDRSDSTIASFDENEGLENPHIIDVGQTTGNTFVAISADGVSLFNPNTFIKSREQVTPVLTNLEVNNVMINGRTLAGDAHFSVDADISVLDDLVLDYKHTKFSIEFSAMELARPDKIQYRYKLEGFDKNWIASTSTNRKATYTSLPAGKYSFRVQATNHDGVWSDSERALNVTMLPPPWRTWWAFGLYALGTTAAIALWRFYDLKRVHLQHRNDHLAELDHLRSNFIANITHEFRTPLTLIIGPLSDLQNQLPDQSHQDLLTSVIRNAKSLLKLINQLLDVSKIDAGKLSSIPSDIELVQLLREIASSYESLAKSKNIVFTFESDIRDLNMFTDADSIEKVVHNLVSNAFKFTTAGGRVELRLSIQGKFAEITVADSGIGIAKDQLNKIFDRFYQINMSQTSEVEGSGLGLTLAKELVELLRGKISVTSQKGIGTTFTIMLPVLPPKREQNGSVIPSLLKHPITASSTLGADNHSKAQALDVPGHQFRVLVVEDNPDMTHYIQSILAGTYQVIAAQNGKDGIGKAEELVPDLIITDIMMPEMDGYQLCQALKANELTCHIPVILLTARADRKSRLSGLESGADDYLSKPFDADELKLIVKKRIEAKQKMQNHFAHETKLWPSKIKFSSLDEKFLKKVLAVIEEHLENEDFTIEDFSSEVGYSHTQLYRKIKALTGQTPSVLLRTIRLRRAADMLIQRSDTITQIAYAVGFSNISYFDKCFREQFGKTPGQFAAEFAQSKKTS